MRGIAICCADVSQTIPVKMTKKSILFICIFQFKNNRKYPIKIETTAGGGIATAKIHGLKEENEYEVIIQSKVTSYINPTTIYKEDQTLEEGKLIIHPDKDPRKYQSRTFTLFEKFANFLQKG
jgi:vancomycin resistance protein YoaR